MWEMLGFGFTAAVMGGLVFAAILFGGMQITFRRHSD